MRSKRAAAQPKARKPARSSGRRPLILLGILAVGMLVAYAKIFRFPFIQDDWGWIYRFRTESPQSLFRTFFTPTGVLFFRPLALSYLYGMYRIFGVNPVPFHVVALLMHFANACLLIAIMRRVTRDELVPYAIGFVYAFAVAIVLDPLLWAVGIFDLGASSLFLLSMYFFMKERPVASAVAYLVGCLFKETVIVLPVILFAYALMARAESRMTLRTLLRRRLAPIAVALCVIVAIKMMGRRPTELGATDPYYVLFFGRDSLYILSIYVACLCQSLVPFGNIKGPSFKPVGVWLLILFVVCVWLVTRRRRGKPVADRALAREFWFFAAWYWTVVLPLLLMPNHAYRYYMMYALPAFVALMFTEARLLISAVRLGHRFERAFIFGLALFAVLSSAICAQTVFNGGMEMNSLLVGTNSLVRKATLVNLVHDGLLKLAPALPPNAVIVLANVDVWAFNKDSGPRIWYGDRTISVYPIESLLIDSTGVYVIEGLKTQGQLYTGGTVENRRVDLDRFFSFALDDEMKFRPAKFK